MSKKVLFSIVIASAALCFAVGTAKAEDQAAPAQAAATAAQNTRPAQTYTYTRAPRQRIGFGFDGIPFNGSHRAATAQRRAARGR